MYTAVAKDHMLCARGLLSTYLIVQYVEYTLTGLVISLAGLDKHRTFDRQYHPIIVIRLLLCKQEDLEPSSACLYSFKSRYV